MVLLAEHQAPPPVDEITVGDSLALRPRLPRARRGPAPKAKPFDAAEIYHTDSQLADITQWRITALLEASKRIFVWEDRNEAFDRAARLERIRGELERRGFDFESLVRQGLDTRIAVSLYTTAIAVCIITDIDENATPMAKRIKSWVPLLGLENIEPAERDDDISDMMVDVFNPHRVVQVRNWIRAASLDDIIDLIPPTKPLEEYESFDDDAFRESRNTYLWIFNRFTTTYLWQWKLSSLKLEWKYQHGLLTPPCNNRDMATFGVSENDLAKQIAAKSVEDDDKESPAPGYNASNFVPVALDLLSSGRRKEAAAIFEATVALTPRDALAINNWAFCLMPEAPDRSLELLERAAEVELGNSPVLIGNRLWCLLRLNRYSTALTLADAVIGTLAERQSIAAYMWSLENDSIEHVDDVRLYVLDLIALLVKRSADEPMSERWRILLDSVRAAISSR